MRRGSSCWCERSRHPRACGVVSTLPGASRALAAKPTTSSARYTPAVDGAGDGSTDMVSGPHNHPLAAPTPKPDVRPAPALRLRLKPKGSLAGCVDGGWWPRSRDLVVELPTLVRVLGVRLGRVTRIAFPFAAWDIPPRQITVDGGTVRLEGFRHQDEYVVHVSGPDRRRISLLVIPPEATTSAAHEAMTAASGRSNVDQPLDLLTASGAVSSETRPRLRLVHDDNQDRWANGGGLPGERG